MLSTLPTPSSIINEAISILDGNCSSDDSVELDATSWKIVTTKDKNRDNSNTSADSKTDAPALTLKDELRNKIKSRRRSAGAGDIEVKFESPKKYPLTQEERRKRETRQQRNRDSANRSRLKRKFKLDYLEKEVSELEKEKEGRVANVSALENLKETLTKTLNTHECKRAKLDEAKDNECDKERTSIDQNETENYNRGRAAFEKLPEHIQEAFVKIFAQSENMTLPEAFVKLFTKTNDGNQPGCSTDG